MDRGDHNEDVSVGFVGFGLTSKKLWLSEKSGPTYFTRKKIDTD